MAPRACGRRDDPAGSLGRDVERGIHPAAAAALRARNKPGSPESNRDRDQDPTEDWMGIWMAVMLTAAGFCQETPDYRRPSDPEEKRRGGRGGALAVLHGWSGPGLNS